MANFRIGILAVKQLLVQNKKTVIAFFVVAFALGNYFGGASADESYGGQPQTPPKVDVQILKPEKIRSWKEFSGRLEAVDRVQVRPRVGGTITQILFKDGQMVKAGDALITIDVRPYAAELRRAEANLASAYSREQLAKTELDRAAKLVERKAISQSEFDFSTSGYKVASSEIKSAQAEHTQAKLNLEYANITAPISGKISRAEYTVGNLIDVAAAPILTTIVANDKLYAEFDVDEESYVNLFGKVKSGEKMPVELLLVGQTEPSRTGELYAFDNQINSQSGTIRARAIFDNADGMLVAGMFAKVRLGSAEEQEKLLVDEKAIGTDQSNKFVYVINNENKVGYRLVKLGDSFAGKRVVLDGLKAGEKVMINSLQKVRPDMQVEPVSVEPVAAVPMAPAPVIAQKAEVPKIEIKKVKAVKTEQPKPAPAAIVPKAINSAPEPKILAPKPVIKVFKPVEDVQEVEVPAFKAPEKIPEKEPKETEAKPAK